MTTLIQQRSGNDCVLASIAMARGAAAWADVWTDSDLERVIASKGVSGYEPWLEQAGFKPHQFKEIQIWNATDQSIVRQLLWHRRALLSVHSLNIDQGHHMVFWDGFEVFDPSPLRSYAWLHSMTITRIVLLDESYLPTPEPRT